MVRGCSCFDAAVERDAARPRNENLTCIQIEETALGRPTDGLRVNDVQAQTVVDRQFWRHVPGVLPIVEVTPLSLTCIDIRADITS